MPLILAVQIRRPVISKLLSGAAEIALRQIFRNDVAKVRLQRLINVVAAFALNEMLRRNRTAAIKTEFDVVAAGAPAHVLNRLIRVLNRRLRRIRIGADVQAQVGFSRDVGESIETGKLKTRIDEKLRVAV